MNDLDGDNLAHKDLSAAVIPKKQPTQPSKAHQLKKQSKPKVNSIFPKQVIAKPKPSTGRTQSLTMGQVQLPEKDKWSKQFQLDLQLAKADTSRARRGITQKQQTQPELDATKIVQSIFGIQSPIISNTGAQYTALGAAETASCQEVAYDKNVASWNTTNGHAKFSFVNTDQNGSTHLRQKKQIDLANQVLKIKSPLEYMIEATPDNKNIMMRNNANSGLNGADTVETEKKSFQHQLQDQNIMNPKLSKTPNSKDGHSPTNKLQRGTSSGSAFSKDFPTLNDTILKPVIHYNAVRGETGFAKVHQKTNLAEEPDRVQTKMKSMNLENDQDEKQQDEIATTLLMRTEQSANGTFMKASKMLNHRPAISQNELSALSPKSPQ